MKTDGTHNSKAMLTKIARFSYAGFVGTACCAVKL